MKLSEKDKHTIETVLLEKSRVLANDMRRISGSWVSRDDSSDVRKVRDTGTSDW